MDFSAIRKEYSLMALNEKDLCTDPLDQFAAWMNDCLAAGIREPNAMALATLSTGGNPSCRMVLLKQVDQLGLVFFTNYTSRKGEEMLSHPQVAATFFWKELERQVRIEGISEKLSRDESARYFSTRSRDSQISASVSPQSQVVESREWLETQWERFARDNEKSPLPYPETWGGFRIVPLTMEFFQGRENRLHDRIRYRIFNGEWIRERLAP